MGCPAVLSRLILFHPDNSLDHASGGSLLISFLSFFFYYLSIIFSFFSFTFLSFLFFVSMDGLQSLEPVPVIFSWQCNGMTKMLLVPLGCKTFYTIYISIFLVLSGDKYVIYPWPLINKTSVKKF